MVYDLRRNWKVTTLVSLILVLVLLFLPGFPWANKSHRLINRQIAGIQKRLARWRGIESKPMSIKGRVDLPGSRIQTADPNYKWAVIADADGRFLLPELQWFPGTTHKLIVSSDEERNYEFEVYAPWAFPAGGAFEVGKLNTEIEYENAATKISGISNADYDSSSDQFYRKLFGIITEGKRSDEEKLAALNHYVAMKRVKKKKPPSRTISPDQLLKSQSPYSFLCGAMSRALAHLAVAGGYEARWVDMIKMREGKRPLTHVVVEIFYAGRWHLYDPTYGVSYKNNYGNIASHREIRTESNMLSQHAYSIREGEKMPRWLADVYSTGLHRVYTLRKLEE